MKPDFEACGKNISALASEIEGADGELFRNESDTRLQIIDRLLFDCLGWDRGECRTERHLARAYTDYELQPSGQGALAVWEAKREGSAFTLPAGLDKRLLKLSTVRSGNPELADAIDQCIEYCQRRSIGVGVVCNGRQLVAFLGSRQDAIPAQDGAALVFTSLAQMAGDFRQLWDALSRPGVAGRNLHRVLRDPERSPPPPKQSSRTIGYPGVKDRNPIQTELQILGDLFLQDISEVESVRERFLRECYCSSGALSQYALVSKQILRARYSVLYKKRVGAASDFSPVATKTGISEQLTTDALVASLEKKPVILLGDVGVGKSIFIQNLIKVGAPELLGSSTALVLYINFGREPALTSDLNAFVLRRIKAQLADAGLDLDEANLIRGVYHRELLRFEKGLYGPLKAASPEVYLQREIDFLAERTVEKEAHLRRCLEHISRGQKRQVVIFLDNVDQRGPDFQDDVFLIGQSFAEGWPMAVFIALRPDTFAHSRVKGSIAAYHPRVFTIAPPRIDQVIARRLAFAISELDSTGSLASVPGMALQSTTLRSYMRVLQRSFEQNRELVQLIDNLSGGNVRIALEFLSDFVGSGHVDSHKILTAYEETGSYTVPVHEFLRAVIFRDNVYYDPGSSRIANVFDVTSYDGREHFLTPIVVSLIENSGAGPGAQGFVPVAQVFQICQGLGYNPDQIAWSVRRAVDKNLIETDPRPQASDDFENARITTVGAYTVRRLISTFTYVDAVAVDTPIIDPKLRAAFYAETLSERLDRAVRFADYLSEQWAPLSGDANAVAIFDWGPHCESLRGEIALVRRRYEQVTAQRRAEQ